MLLWMLGFFEELRDFASRLDRAGYGPVMMYKQVEQGLRKGPSCGGFR